MSAKPPDNPEIDIEIDVDKATEQYQNHGKYHTDADGIRRKFSVPPFDPDEFHYPSTYPDSINHVWEGEPRGSTRSKGGTDMMAIAKPGAGKSTFLLHTALRLMEQNDEIIVWRASSSRSEWLPFAPWARVCLPEGVDVNVELQPRDPSDETITDVDLDDLVREIVRYKDPVELNQNHLKQGQFHVVYPDPQFRGCQAIYSESDKVYEDLSFEEGQPTIHWWFAWVLARVEHGPHYFTSLIFDEIGDWVPQSAAKDEFATYQKIELLKDSFVDARKFGLSLMTAGHSETDVHEMIRKKIRWRVRFSGESNPTTASECNGFNSVPMEVDMMSDAPVGQAIIFNESRFERLSYPDYPAPIPYKVQVRLS